MRHKILTPISILGMTILTISILHEIYLQFAQNILATTSWSSTILVGFASIVLFTIALLILLALTSIIVMCIEDKEHR